MPRQTTHLPPDLHRRLKIRAAVEGRSLSTLLADAVRAYLKLPMRKPLKGAP